MEAHLDLRFDGVLRDAYRLRYIPAQDAKGARIPNAFATACWCWQSGPDAPHHDITFGEALAAQLKEPTPERLSAYAIRYYHHEKSHSLRTERNLKALSSAAKKDGVPFSLINLLEDARIEHLEREATKCPFGWTGFEGKNPGETPGGYFLAIIQADGNPAEAICETGPDFTEDQAARVRDYYFPASLKCPSTWAILKLAKEWVKEFGAPPSGGAGASGSGSGERTLNEDMVAALEAQMSAALREAIEGAASDLGGDKDSKSTPKAASMGERHSVEVEEFSTGDVLCGSTNLDIPLVESLTAMSRRAFPRTQSKVCTISPSKRLNMRNVMRDMDRVYRRKVEGDEISPMQIVFMLDCSGSMTHKSGYKKLTAHDIGCVVLAVLSRLAQQGIVKGHAILTVGENRKARCQTFPLPMADDQIRKIFSNGEFEGFDSAMRVCSPLLKQAALVLAYTDGHIRDARVEKAFWHRHGIYSVGMYCGDIKLATSLGDWFDSALARETPEGLIDALTQILLKWSKTKALAA